MQDLTPPGYRIGSSWAVGCDPGASQASQASWPLGIPLGSPGSRGTVGFMGGQVPMAASESRYLGLPRSPGTLGFLGGQAPLAPSEFRCLWLAVASSESLDLWLPRSPRGFLGSEVPGTSPWLARSPGTFGFLRLPRSQGRYLPCLLLQGALPLPRELSPRPQPPMIAPAGAIAQTPAADDSSKSRYLWLSVASSLASL